MLSKEVSAIGKRSTVKGLCLFAFDCALYVVLLCGVVMAESVGLRLLLAIATGFGIGFLFLIGHDACHNSLTPHKRLNRVVGSLAFLPSLTTFSLWALGHNQTHHRYTNLKTRDYVWRPLSKPEYDRASRWSRWEYRFYRTPVGCLFYYLVDIWWRRLFFYELTVSKKSIYSQDRVLVSGFAVAQVVFVFGVHLLTRGGVLPGPAEAMWLVLTALVLPFLVWNCLASFLIFLHHTNPKVCWYANEKEWSYGNAQIECTVHLVFPRPVNWLLHRIMEHTAHHVNPALPCYGLKRAQQAIEEQHRDRVVVQPWSLREFLDITARCKLYDYENHAWLDFHGNRTTEPTAKFAPVIEPVRAR